MHYAFLLGLFFDADDGALFVVLLPVEIDQLGFDAHGFLLGVDGFEEEHVGEPVQRGLHKIEHQIEKLHELELVARVVLVHVFEHRLVLVEGADEVGTVDALLEIGIVLHKVEEELLGVVRIGGNRDELLELGALLLHLVHDDVDERGQKIRWVGLYRFLGHAGLRILARQVVLGGDVHMPESFVSRVVRWVNLFGFDVHASEAVLNSQLAAFLGLLF